MPDLDAASDSAYRPCVGLMIMDRRGLVWVGRRVGLEGVPGSTGVMGWQMPQGGIDDGETPREAAVRELAEETGIQSVEIVAESAGWHRYDLPPALGRKAWKGRWVGQRQKWFLMRFLGDDSEISIEARPGHKQEFDAWRWAPLGEVEAQIVAFKRPVYSAVVAEFGALVQPL